MAVFFPVARFENTTVVTEVQKETFLSRGRVVLEAGWRALYPGGVGGRMEKEPPVLPPIEVGQEWAVRRSVSGGETKPPPRYSESAARGDGDGGQARRGRGAQAADEGLGPGLRPPGQPP